jgi:hypothetical protein
MEKTITTWPHFQGRKECVQFYQCVLTTEKREALKKITWAGNRILQAKKNQTKMDANSGLSA